MVIAENWGNMRVVGGNIYLVDVAVELVFLKIHEEFGYFCRPAVAPNVGVAIRPPKNSSYTGVADI